MAAAFNKNSVEIVKADIYYRRRLHYVMLLALVLLFVAIVFLPETLADFVHGYIDDNLAKLSDFQTGGVTADVRVALNIFVLLAVIWGYFFVLMVWVLFIAARMLRAPQWPLPHASVTRDTRVQRGLRLKLTAWIMILVPLLLIAVVSRPVAELAFGAWEMYTASYAKLKSGIAE
ncbi:MAG: hypothetical protein FD165_1309 [Gammaproteobacteria bacterium]|nr:MAG: hypothetical protein FD165_1309 [Gammaproteobacteria bacterium]TND05808.1 MAG: hypothetical protein FD120_1021 [Gammaproteobacteria bacterium]